MAIEDPNEQERILVHKAREKAQAQARRRHINQAIDTEGQVKVWDVVTGQSRRLWPVDAAEQVAAGLVTLTRSETETPSPTAKPTTTAAPPPAPTPPEPPAADKGGPKARSSKGKAKGGDTLAPEAEPQPDGPPT